MNRLQKLANMDPIADLLKAKAKAGNWNAVALAMLLRDQWAQRHGAARITSDAVAHLANLLRERCDVKL